MRVTVDDSHDTDADTLGVYLDDGTEVGRLPVLQHCQIEAMNLRQMLWAVSQEAVKAEGNACEAIADAKCGELVERMTAATQSSSEYVYEQCAVTAAEIRDAISARGEL